MKKLLLLLTVLVSLSACGEVVPHEKSDDSPIRPVTVAGFGTDGSRGTVEWIVNGVSQWKYENQHLNWPGFTRKVQIRSTMKTWEFKVTSEKRKPDCGCVVNCIVKDVFGEKQKIHASQSKYISPNSVGNFTISCKGTGRDAK